MTGWLRAHQVPAYVLLLRFSIVLCLLSLFIFSISFISVTSAYSLHSAKTMPLLQSLKGGPLRASIIGSGNWGSVIGKIVATNTRNSYIFSDEVKIWVHQEEVNGRLLTEIINEQHENVKYLPNVPLPSNLKAVPNIEEAVKDSDLLIFVLPHQFLKKICGMIAESGAVKPSAKAISLVKGFYVDDENKPKLFSSLIRDTLQMDCCVLSGANVADEVAKEQFSEATIGYTDVDTARIWQQLFDRPYFKMCGVPDVSGVELCGALKNVIALAAGFCDGLKLGTNPKSAVIRQGFEELRAFSVYFFDGILEETFFDSAGIADTITSCFGGRNARCAAEFVRSNCLKSWKEIEDTHLNGQKLQGTLTCQEVYQVLNAHKLLDSFPLFSTAYGIAFKNSPPSDIINNFKSEQLRKLKLLSECTECLLPSEVKRIRARSGSL